jgi:hypothetical protein
MRMRRTRTRKRRVGPGLEGVLELLLAVEVLEQLPRGVGVPVRKQHVAVCVHDRLEEVVRPVAHLHTRRQERGGREE